MLKTLSKLERTRNWFIYGFIFLMVISIGVVWQGSSLFGPGTAKDTSLMSQSTESLAKVGRDYVTVGDVVSQRENYRRMSPQYAAMFTEKRLLDGMIHSKVVAQEAARLGLTASDAEVRDEIFKRTKGADGQFIGWDKYQQYVKSNFGDVEKYEQGIRDSISSQKLEALITAGVSVSEQEILDDYKRQHVSFELSYITVATDKLAQNIKPTDAELQAYYDKHKDEYKISVPQKKYRYLFIKTEKVGEKLSIPDEDLRKEYDQLSPEKKKAGAKVQQIVLKIAHEKLDAAQKAKADELVRKAREKGPTVSEQTFADLAKGNSEDPATAKNGGWLSGLVRENPNKPDDPLQQTVNMPVGSITEPIKFGNAYYIFRRGDDVPKSFEDAKTELMVSARNRKAYAAAAALAQKAADKVKSEKDIQKVAQELAAEANMSAADMVKETPYVKPGDDVPNIGVSQQFEDGVKNLNNVNDVGDRTPIKEGFAIPMLIDQKGPRVADLSEVKDKITDAVKKEKAKGQVEQTAKDIASAVNSPADLKAAAEKYGLKALDAKDYKLGSPLGEAGADQTVSNPALENAIYDLKEGGVTKTAVKSGDNYVIVGATKRKEADLAEYDKQKDQLKESALQQKKSKIFGDYIQNIVDKMKKDGSIVIYKEVLARISEPAEPEFPEGLTPGGPGGGQIPIPQGQ